MTLTARRLSRSGSFDEVVNQMRDAVGGSRLAQGAGLEMPSKESPAAPRRTAV
jgi:hypothetical protein